jgi:hypothetical protein
LRVIAVLGFEMGGAFWSKGIVEGHYNYCVCVSNFNGYLGSCFIGGGLLGGCFFGLEIMAM